MSNKKTSGGFSSLVASISIAISFVIGILVYLYIFGDSSNFVNGDNTLEPLENTYLGIIYKGRFIVPILLAIIFIRFVVTGDRHSTPTRGKAKVEFNVLGVHLDA